MLPRAIIRRLFIVPLANNDHGKTTMIRSLVRQGERRDVDIVRRASRTLYSPWGRVIDALEPVMNLCESSEPCEKA